MPAPLLLGKEGEEGCYGKIEWKMVIWRCGDGERRWRCGDGEKRWRCEDGEREMEVWGW